MLSPMLSKLTFHDAIVVTVAAGLSAHLIFKRFEPWSPLYHLALLVLAPAALVPLFAAHSASTLLATATAFAIYNSALLGSLTFYRLSPFHPLAKYPGPIACKLSKLWLAWICLSGKQHIYYFHLHEKYGDIVRIGPNELSIRNVDAVDGVLGGHGLPKGPMWEGRAGTRTQKPNTLIALSGPEHAQRRKAWNRAFNSAALKGYEEIIEKRVMQLVGLLDNESSSGEVDLAKCISYFTYDFMSDMAFGGGSEMMQEGDKQGLWHLLEGGQNLSLFLGHVPWLRPYYEATALVGRNNRAFVKFCLGRAALRQKEGSMSKDVFYHLIDEEGHEPEPPSLKQVLSDAILVIVAGSDTTATVLCNIFWFLLCNPSAYRRLQEEIDAVFPPGENAMDTTKHVHMDYLNAVINESLRLLPPVLSGSQRAAPRGSGGSTVGPYFVPEGTASFVHFYSLHRDPRYFSPSPDTFYPERWLSTSAGGPEKLILNKDAFIPFSHGPSNCVGKNLAMQEMRVVVCLLMQTFEMKLGVKDGFVAGDWERDFEDMFVARKGRLPVNFSRRVKA